MRTGRIIALHHRSIPVYCTNSVASGGARSDCSSPPTVAALLLFIALSASEKEKRCPKELFMVTADLGGIAGVSLILLMPPGDLQFGEERNYVQAVQTNLLATGSDN